MEAREPKTKTFLRSVQIVCRIMDSSKEGVLVNFKTNDASKPNFMEAGLYNGLLKSDHPKLIDKLHVLWENNEIQSSQCKVLSRETEFCIRSAVADGEMGEDLCSKHERLLKVVCRVGWECLTEFSLQKSFYAWILNNWLLLEMHRSCLCTLKLNGPILKIKVFYLKPSLDK